MTDEPLLAYKVGHAAALLGCSRAHLYKFVMDGSVRSVLIGHARRIPRDELERIAREGISPEATP